MGGTNPTTPPPTTPPPPPAPPALTTVPAPPPAVVPPGPRSAASSALATLSQAELLILGGGALIVAVDLLFSIILDWYFIDEATFLLAAAAALGVALTRFMGMSLPLDYTTWLVVAGLLLGLLGVRNLVWDLFILGRRGSAQSIEYILPAVLLYVGTALVFFGAWQLWRERRA